VQWSEILITVCFLLGEGWLASHLKRGNCQG